MLGKEEWCLECHVNGSEDCKLYEFCNQSTHFAPQSDVVKCTIKGMIYTYIMSYPHMKFHLSDLNDTWLLP
jgi:hypothetical protein